MLLRTTGRNFKNANEITEVAAGSYYGTGHYVKKIVLLTHTLRDYRVKTAG